MGYQLRSLSLAAGLSEFNSIDQILAEIEFPAEVVELVKLEFEIKLAFEESFPDQKHRRVVLIERYFDRIGFEKVRKILIGLFASKAEPETPDTLTLFFEFLGDVAQKFAHKFGSELSFPIFAQSFQFLFLKKFEKICSEAANKQRNLLIIKFLQNFTAFLKSNLQQGGRGGKSALTLSYLGTLAEHSEPGIWESVVKQLSEVYFSSPESYFQQANNRLSIDRQRFDEFSHHFLGAFAPILQMALIGHRGAFDTAFERMRALFNFFFESLKKVGLLSQRLLLIDSIRTFANQMAVAVTEAAACVPEQNTAEELGYLSLLKVNANTHVETLAGEATKFIEKNLLLKLFGNKKLLYEFDEFMREFTASFEKAGFDFRQLATYEIFFKEFGQKARALSDLIVAQPFNQNQIKELSAKLNTALLSLVPKQAQPIFLANFTRAGNLNSS